MNRKQTLFVWYWVAGIAIFMIDRISKWYAVQHWQTPYSVAPCVSFELVFNRGISWGMFHSSHMLTFGIVSALIAALTGYVGWIAYERLCKQQIIIGEVMILAGSISNLLDRVMYGGVVDFILISYKSWSWPVFNVADMSIVCGVFIMLWELNRS